mmetsp:Transcript_9260/g.42177  ORF Transcript_9260/g.42177 Transcript_9260/m.42177 type:complete len:264 (+) Transcript_9260:1421-2212(+)
MAKYVGAVHRPTARQLDGIRHQRVHHGVEEFVGNLPEVRLFLLRLSRDEPDALGELVEPGYVVIGLQSELPEDVGRLHEHLILVASPVGGDGRDENPVFVRVEQVEVNLRDHGEELLRVPAQLLRVLDLEFPTLGSREVQKEIVEHRRDTLDHLREQKRSSDLSAGVSHHTHVSSRERQFVPKVPLVLPVRSLTLPTLTRGTLRPLQLILRVLLELSYLGKRLEGFVQQENRVVDEHVDEPNVKRNVSLRERLPRALVRVHAP